MNRGMRHVIGSAALAAGILLCAAPAFAQLPPWAQDRRRPQPQQPPQQQHQQHRAVRPAPPAHQQQQVRQPQPQQQPQRTKPEPVQNVAERAACLNKDTPQAALIEACRVVIEAGKDRPATMATMYFNRGEAYREKGDLDNAIKDLGESINLEGKNAAAYFARATAQ